MKKIINTTFDFPIVKISCDVKYSQVEKPTGIAYILLMIIYSSKNRKDNFSSLLVSFGVPIDLHDIFAEELSRLISLKIIYFRNNNESGFNYTQFKDYNVGNFLFTEYGRKIFTDKVIPLDKEILIKIDVFWNIAHNELLLSQDKLLNFDQSQISQSIFDNNKFQDNDKLEDFLVKHRDKGIKIKSEEIITEVLPFNFQYFVKTYSMDIEIENNNVLFVFQDKFIESFFYREYSSKLIENVLKNKDIFKFKGTIHKIDNKILDDFDVLIPEDIKKELKSQTFLDIYRGDYIPTGSSIQMQSSSILDFINKDIEFIKIVDLESGYYYIPAEISFNNFNYGSISIHTLLKNKLSKTQINVIARESVKICSQYSKENIKVLSSVCEKFELNDVFYETILNYVDQDNESNLLLLKEIISLNVLAERHLNYIRKLVKTNLDLFVSEINEKNLKQKLEIIDWVPNFLKNSEISLLEIIIKVIKQKEYNCINIFEILENNNFDVKDILVYLNPIPLYLKQEKAAGFFGQLILNFIEIFKEMEKIIGIKSISGKTKEDINPEISLKKYREFNTLYYQVKEYEKYFDGEFEKIKSLFKITSELNEKINDEKNAELNPNLITKFFVSSKISKGDYRSAIINLSIKLESILKIDYKLKGKLSDMLDDLLKSKIIDDQVYKQLNNFRNIRNSYGAHYKENNIEVKAADLEKWSEIIFDLNKTNEKKVKK
jgi:hypothetical protein